MNYTSEDRVDSTVAWQALQQHYSRIHSVDMRRLFAEDGQRVARFSRQLQGLKVDFSKNRLILETLVLLTNLANERNLVAGIEQMFQGGHINTTEKRAALHVALRWPTSVPLEHLHPSHTTLLEDIFVQRQKMALFTDQLHRGVLRGSTGKMFTDVVNIGIGGSDLGPRLLHRALQPYAVSALRFHFVANIDPYELEHCLARLTPETTLFVVCSKSFNTVETLGNAEIAKEWLMHGIEQDSQAFVKHFIAATSNAKAAQQFGIDERFIFKLWDSIGGRFSLMSSIGITAMLLLGEAQFEQLLAGAHAMDLHFRHTSLMDNIPVILGLLGIWYRNFFQVQSHAVIPYAEQLSGLVAYLQQLEMESNGKSMSLQGRPIGIHTAPVVWGQTGTPGQHAFFQSLHQGTDWTPIDFIGIAHNPHTKYKAAHTTLLANMLAQSAALMQGQSFTEALQKQRTSAHLDPLTQEQTALHQVFAGNRPSTILLLEQLNPYNLGMLLALFEHKVFVQAHIWGINAFDQFGVELGKTIAASMRNLLCSSVISQKNDYFDASTCSLVNTILQWQRPLKTGKLT